MLNDVTSDGGPNGKLVSLKDASGKSLNIVSGDKITVSLVCQGQVISTTVTIGSATTLSSVLKNSKFTNYIDSTNSKYDNTMKATTPPGQLKGSSGSKGTFTDTAGHEVTTPNGGNAFVIMSNTAGVDKQISGLSITITDALGNSKKSANEHLEFSVLQFAADKQDKDNSVKIHVGTAAGQTISIGLADMRAESLGLQASDATVINVSTPEKANAAISAFDYALAKALDQATTIGAIQARLEYTANNLTTESENVQAAESTIRDADMAKEMTNYTKNNVLLQAAQSMLAQANQNSSAVLSLLQ